MNASPSVLRRASAWSGPSLDEVSGLSELVLVGLGSGAVGAYAGVLYERRRYVEERAKERMAALWDLERALRFAGDQLTLEGGRRPGSFLMDAEQAAFPYYDTLPLDIRDALEPDVRRSTSFEDGDALVDVARKLRAYLEKEEGEAARGTPTGHGSRPASRFSRAWSSLKEN
jgi:hypothetical protein